MAENESGSTDSPPLPRGAYNFNFDDIDENSNPFESRKRIDSSPDRDTNNSNFNPFQTKTKMASSPVDIIEQNPFQTKTKMASSPVNIIEENPFKTKSKVASSPPKDFDNEENPFQSKSKIASSPPKDFDNEENPFQSKSKVASSPQNEQNPFKTKSKLGNSPTKDFDGEENPFKTKSNLSNSPPGQIQSVLNENVTDSVDQSHIETADESHTQVNTSAERLKDSGDNTVQASPLAEDAGEDSLGEKVQDGGADVGRAPKSKLKKMSSPKKGSGIKKPKARSKFKPPENFGVQESDEVVIFAPPPRRSTPDSLEPDQDNTVTSTAGDQNEADQELETREQEPVSCENVSDLPNQMPGIDAGLPNPVPGIDTGGDIGAANAMNAMMDSVHDFGAGEMPQINEGFVPASEAFNEEAWQMMEKLKNEDNINHDRDSLYTKFDPLVATDEVPNKATSHHSEQDSENDLMLMNTPQVKSRVSRHPAARALQEQVDGDGAPKEAHVIDKMLFSPVKGQELKPTGDDAEHYYDAPEFPLGSKKYWAQQGDSDVDHVSSSSGKKQGGSDQENIVQLVQVLKYSQSDWNKMKQDSELDYNARILNKEREWSKKLADRDKKITHLEEQSLILRSTNEDMRCVVAEFEKTISQLQAEKEKSTSESQQGFEDVVKERDQALEDLQSVETAFSDLHQRYERVKGVVEGFKKNEDVLKKCVQDYQGKLKAAEERAVSVRQQAEDKLDQAYQEIDKVRRTTTAEVARLEAALKKSELKIHGLERGLEQKVKENDELTAICDELIAKVGGD